MLDRESIPSVRPANVWEPCPCASGKKYIHCCKKSVRVAQRAPKSPKTGFAHPQCYAASLNDCGEEISKEHPVPAAIVKRMMLGGGVKANNNSSVPNGLRLPPAALTAAVLCKRHNNALSELDQRGLAFYFHLEQVMRQGFGVSMRPSASLFSGLDLERWFLKISAAHIAAGWTGPKQTIPKSWCDVIWGDTRLERPNGLYFRQVQRNFQIGFGHGVVYGPSGDALGAHFVINGISLWLHFDSLRRRPDVDVVSHWRPTIFEMRTNRGAA